MRFHMNPHFQVEKAKLEVCKRALLQQRSAQPPDAQSIRAAQDKLDVAIAKFVSVVAYNGMETLLQLEAMLDHTDEWMANGGAFERSLMEASRPQPSPAMISAFGAFRSAWLAQADYDNSDRRAAGEEIGLHNAVCDTIEGVFTVQCATPGDFLVKSYVNLLWHAGHTGGRRLHNGESGNFFDVDLPNIDSDSKVTDAHYRSIYADLDHCDLGACLLATGNINFDPRGWVERAGSIGLPIQAVVLEDGECRLSFGFIDTQDDRLLREEARLQRLLTFAPRLRRGEIARFIDEHRPDLMLVASALRRAAA